MTTVEIRKIADFPYFKNTEFCVLPKYWGYKFEYAYNVSNDILEEAKRLALEVDEICIAVIHDEKVGDYVLGESCSKGCCAKFVLYNAEKCERTNGEVRSITYNTGLGARTKFWYDQWVRYTPGSIA